MRGTQLLRAQVKPAVKCVRLNGIEATALHSHMVNSPHLMFMHFWGSGDALVLASKLRAAIDLSHSMRAP